MNKTNIKSKLAEMLLKKRTWKSISYREFFEKYLCIRDRETSEIIPFKVNSSQQKLLDIVENWQGKYPDERERPTLYVIILKARRRGFSTCTEAIFFRRLIQESNKVGMVVSYDDDSAVNISDMSNVFYQHLDQDIKPARRPAAGKGIILENPKFDSRLPISGENNPGLQSKFLIETARNMNAGSSFNLHYLHLSELAKWPGDPKITMTSLLQAVPSRNSIVIVESTALGFNYFKELWDGAVSGDNDYIPVFVAWFEDEGHQMPYSGFKLTEEELELQERYNLALDQLEWRRWSLKNKCSNDINQFKQEYPSCPEEAFLFTGRPIFHNSNVVGRIEVLRKQYKDISPIRGRFSFEWQNPKAQDEITDNSIRFVEDPNGWVTIYAEPEDGIPYVIGGDTKGEGSDLFAATVINNHTGKRVATLHANIDADVYTHQVYCLGKYYNTALIGIEINFDIYPVKELERLYYLNQYTRQTYDDFTGKYLKKYGWKTDGNSRPLIIDKTISLTRDNIDLYTDIATLQEMLTFVRDKAGRPDAMSGKHDDLLFSDMIANEIRTQQTFEVVDKKGVETKKRYGDDDDDDDLENNWFNDSDGFFD